MSKRKYIISIDLGTQGTETVLYDSDGRKLVSVDKESELKTLSGGIAEEDADSRYKTVLLSIKEVMEKSGVAPSDVAAIGFDGQMAGIMGIDDDWNAVTPYDSWLDTRCEKYMEPLRADGEEHFIALTGCTVTYAHGPKILWWKHERPETYNRIKKFVMMTTYMSGKLAGLKAKDAYIDYTQLHFAGFADINALEWSSAMLATHGVDRDKMPEICEPWKVIGKLEESQAKLCGLIAGIPIVAGVGDQAATSFGAGVARKGHGFDVAGTASLFAFCVDRFRPDTKNRTIIYPRAVMKGMWIPQAYINGGGLSLRWAKEMISQDNNDINYAVLEKEARAIKEGSEELIFIPHFQGVVCPNVPFMRGAFLGLNWIHKRGHLFRAVMESIGYEYASYLSILKELLPDVKIEHVAVTGGGAKSAIFNQIKANILGIPYSVSKRLDAPTLGTAVVAGYGVGLYNDLVSTVESALGKVDIVQPSQEAHEKYKKYSAIYKLSLEKLQDIYKPFINN